MDMSKILATLLQLVASRPQLIPLALAVIANANVQRLGAAVPALVSSLTEAAAKQASTWDMIRIGATWAQAHDVAVNLRAALNDDQVFEFLTAAVEVLRTTGETSGGARG